jgi:hypothetical protein
VSKKQFDLNIEKILEDWETCHAIREVIANAIDEQILTQTKEIDIFKDARDHWHIRDYGRGLKHEHLTQKENEEKLGNSHMIGKFGIGLKDALATFDRNRVNVLIESKYGKITLGKSQKHGFEDIITLHAYISPPSDTDFVGTEFILKGIKDDDILKAKNLFLRFSGERVIEKTKYGDVLEKKAEAARIYVNGVRVAEEENFLFSYNITSLTSAIRKAMNRERTNVGRTAYSGRVKSMLLSCQNKEVAVHLVNDLKNYEVGRLHDELNWIDVQEQAVKTLNAFSRVVFLTSEEMMHSSMMVDEAITSGLEIITIPVNLKERIKGQTDIAGKPIRDLGQLRTEYNESFEFKFVESKDLTPSERNVFNMTESVLELIGGKPANVTHIAISETMRRDSYTFVEVEGLWEPTEDRVVVKRDVLNSLERYAGVLLHEVGHAICGAGDLSRAFEHQLTIIIGMIASKALK